MIGNCPAREPDGAGGGEEGAAQGYQAVSGRAGRGLKTKLFQVTEVFKTLFRFFLFSVIVITQNK